MTIKNINNGLDYVQDDAAVALFGAIEKTVIFEDVTIAENLLKKGQEKLQEYINSTVSIELSAADLHNLDVNIEAFRIGDNVQVISKPHGLDRYFLLSKLSLALDSVSSCSMILGATFKTFTQKQIEAEKKLNANVQKNTENVAFLNKNVVTIENNVEKLDEDITKIDEDVKEINSSLIQVPTNYVKTIDFESYKKEVNQKLYGIYTVKGSVADFETFKGGNIIVGSRHFMTDRNVSGLDNFENEKIPAGYNILYVARDNKLMGLIVINDPIRPQMKKTFNQMRRHGIDEIVMLTGDSKDVAATVAQQLGIDSYFAEILPEDKANIVNYLQRNGHVLMVGDGINDAPALAFADVGVALGGRRTDIAVESSDITINSDNPTKLMDALELGQNTMRLIRQNFTATITINSAAMLLGALGKINPLVAAIIHNTATLAVVLNSARILMPKRGFLMNK